MREITELNELKKIELNIMKDIHMFCMQNNIEYYLSYGTLIGAIRHEGFIPWDDDIDIFIPRKEYERFCKLFIQQKQFSNLQLVNHTTSIYYGRPMSKVIDTRTVLTEPEFKGDDPIGVFVDVWPLDGFPNGKIRAKLHALHAEFYRRLLYVSITNAKARNLKKKIAQVILSPIPTKWIVQKLDSVIQKYPYENAEYVACFLDPYHEIMKKSWFSESIIKKFEDASFMVPVHFDEVLTSIYGDYMELPPIEKQVPHHVINTFWKDME